MTTPHRRLLVAIDFSDGSDESLARAIELAKDTGALIEILYVLEPEVEMSPFGVNYLGNTGGLLAYIDLELARRRDLVNRAGLVCLTKTIEGTSAAAEIVKHARDIGADMIVVGTHGRTGLPHAFLGSVAEKVVQHADCPVLTVPYSRKAA